MGECPTRPGWRMGDCVSTLACGEFQCQNPRTGPGYFTFNKLALKKYSSYEGYEIMKLSYEVMTLSYVTVWCRVWCWCGTVVPLTHERVEITG